MKLTNQIKLIHFMYELLVLYFAHSIGHTITRNSNDLHSINTAQIMKFSIKDFFSKCADLVTVYEKVLNEKLQLFVQCIFQFSIS